MRNEKKGVGKGRRKGEGRGKEKRGKKAEESPLLDYSCGCSKQNKVLSTSLFEFEYYRNKSLFVRHSLK